MAYTLKTNIAKRDNYGNKRSTSKIKYIVIHYTGNDGDTDENNGKYFKNNITNGSAHYFVDDDSVTQSVPDNYVAHSVGGSKYANCSTTGGGKFYGKCTNDNSLSIELCDDVKDGKVYPSKKTIENALEFVKAKMKEYNIPKENVIRHFDVNGKSCPAYWCGSDSKNKKWKTEFLDKLTTSTKKEPAKETTKEPAKEPTKETTDKSTSTSLKFKVDDVVMFNGSKHYTGAASTTGSSCKKGKAKVSAVKKGAKHPYHLIAVSGGGSNVHGWVNEKDVEKYTEPAKTSTSKYYKKYTGEETSIDKVFKAIGVPEKYMGSWSKRKAVAKANGINIYTGSKSQNDKLIVLAKKGKLVKP